MSGCESSEIGGVTDEDMMLLGKVVFQFGSGFRCHFHQEEIGLRLGGCDARDLVEHFTQTSGLGKEGAEAVMALGEGRVFGAFKVFKVLRVFKVFGVFRVLQHADIIFHQPDAGLYGQGVDRPGPDVHAERRRCECLCCCGYRQL